MNSSALEKIWDKVIGGSLKILVFAAVSLVETSKMALQGCQTSQEAIRCLKTVRFFFFSYFEKIIRQITIFTSLIFLNHISLTSFFDEKCTIIMVKIHIT